VKGQEHIIVLKDYLPCGVGPNCHVDHGHLGAEIVSEAFDDMGTKAGSCAPCQGLKDLKASEVIELVEKALDP
jgi:hypothetical protein